MLLTDPKNPPAYADVVFNLPLKGAFTYEIPARFNGMVRRGMRVFVPFGRRKLTGYVVALSDRNEKNITLKPIEDLPDTEPVISEELLSLTRWISEYYHSSWGEAIKAALPAGLDDESLDKLALTELGVNALDSASHPATGSKSAAAHLLLQALHEKRSLTAKQLERLLKKKFSTSALTKLKRDGLVETATQIKRSSLNYKYEKSIRRAAKLPAVETIDKLLNRSPKQRAVYEKLAQGEITVAELTKEIPSAADAIRKLKEKGLIETFTCKNERKHQEKVSDPSWTPEAPLKFNADQERCYRELESSIEAGKFQPYLLHGVTGSGKTEIYLRCIRQTLDLGKSAIMIVLEISLTPQTVERFQRRFGDQVAVLHSGLTQKERFLEWKKIREEKVSIVVGARSAIFAPFKNLGIIVIDEEHDTSYKQDSSPRYHARDTAMVRAREQNAVVLLGSATPSLESAQNAASGKYRRLVLGNRVLNRLLPMVKVTDMKQEMEEKKNFSIFSIALKNALRERLERGEQAFLFLNRRGTASYVFCRECGFAFECPRCSVTLTFHGNEHSLRCHYCNFSVRMPKACADCNGEVIRFSGFGTQKLEAETRRLFPQARIARIDRDTTRGRDAFESMHRKMNAGEIDILIGTQMITKGHDFPNVTLVGVVHADLSIHIPDFRSAERSFQLLTQVAGRAGRGKVPGLVIVQTHTPDHYVFKYVKEHDYDGFSEKELAFRKKLNYPPFTRMAAMEIESEQERAGEILASKIQQALVKLLKEFRGVELLGPSRAALYRINNRFRRHLILRAEDHRRLQSVLRRLHELPELKKASNAKLKWTLDVDPINLL
ncbi:MAG: primosomal protein N' [Nitrospinae bacterium]|nr:primosomal protein N' [Nitrospinota bacterium]